MMFGRWIFIVILLCAVAKARTDELADETFVTSAFNETDGPNEWNETEVEIAEEDTNLTSSIAHARESRACPRAQQVPPPRFGEWSHWSACSRTCGPGGVRHRRRQCAAWNPDCRTSESQSCNQRPCSPGWSEWCEWEACRATCGTGERQRIRFCEGGTLRCPGKDYQVSRCNAGIPCPGFHEWSAWTACSVSCGLGVQRRERQCFDPLVCRGNRSEERRCNDGPCNRYGHGQWTQWSAWTSCDRECDGGLTSRRRVCHPRRENCRGDESETRRCNEHPCPAQRRPPPSAQTLRCQWTTWASWSACHAAPNYDCRQGAGVGVRSRQRYCVGRSRGENCEWTCGGGAQSSQERENCRLEARNDPCHGRVD